MPASQAPPAERPRRAAPCLRAAPVDSASRPSRPATSRRDRAARRFSRRDMPMSRPSSSTSSASCCQDCGRWRIVTWADYLAMPDDVGPVCPSTPLGAWLNDEAGPFPAPIVHGVRDRGRAPAG